MWMTKMMKNLVYKTIRMNREVERLEKLAEKNRERKRLARLKKNKKKTKNLFSFFRIKK